MYRVKLYKGIGLLELVIAVAIIVIALLSFAQAAVVFLRGAILSEEPQAASYLAQEGIEAVRSLRDQSWTTNITPLINGTQYYLSTSSSGWLITTTNPGPIQGKFTRSIVLEEVRRDSGGKSDILLSGGSVDPNTRKLTVTIQWIDQQGVARTYSVPTYITNFTNN
ncbi:hypothetical protein C4553_02015 [Candidatus Parcubacteria bacterium]|nr:MAG: hypothetical protein C4553_02015 [Candidatus Parcubacteria bacterium]